MMRWLFGKTSPPSVIGVLPAGDAPWEPAILLVEVSSGKGTLRWVWSRDDQYEAYPYNKVLLLKETPLLIWSIPYCPTCEQLLARGYGIENVDRSAIRAIEDACNDPDTVIASGDITPLVPILQLLEPGVYGIAAHRLYPTDGAEHFFWDVSRETKVNPGLIPILHADSWPAFLYPTQSTSSFDKQAAEAYLDRLTRGEKIGGLAMFLGSFTAALLDGHHRATACCLAGEALPCLTIDRAGGMWIKDNMTGSIEGGLFCMGRSFRAPKYKDKFEHVLNKYKAHDNQVSVAQMKAWREQSRQTASANLIPDEVRQAARKYPHFLGMRALAEFGRPVTDELIVEALERPWRRESFRLMQQILPILTGMNDSRAKPLALRLACDEEWAPLWETVYAHLAQNPSKNVDKVFIDYLVNDTGTRPYITEIVDDYFARQAREHN